MLYSGKKAAVSLSGHLYPFTSTSSKHGMFTYHMKQLIFTYFSGDRYSNRKHKTTDQFKQLAGQYSWSELSAVVATCVKYMD